MNTINIRPGKVSLSDLSDIYFNPVKIVLDPSVEEAMQRSLKVVDDMMQAGKTVYGINTGFGLLAKTTIDQSQLYELQRKLVLSHAAGVGDYLSENTARLIMALKINSLSQGYSGVRYEVVDYLVQFFNAQMAPCIRGKGSVGASGDLAPLADIASVLIGEGKVSYKGKIISATKALTILNLPKITLEKKEGLALLNGTQASTALALQGLFLAKNVFNAAMVAGAMSVEAARASHRPFDARVHDVRGQLGQIIVAERYRNLLKDSDINGSHQDCKKVQDPYCLRCQPQVMGACYEQIEYASGVLLREANGVTDNPLIFSDPDDIVSGGNFHAEPVAFAADNLALAIAEIGALSERRIALLIDPSFSSLPTFLVQNGGLDSGFMIAQVTAAALASENKSLAHPASVDSLPTSANQEDHVSMATYAARRLKEMAFNSSNIVAIELLAATQGLDFLKPLSPALPLRKFIRLIREKVSFYAEDDRIFSDDIEKINTLVLSNTFAPEYIKINEDNFADLR